MNLGVSRRRRWLACRAREILSHPIENAIHKTAGFRATESFCQLDCFVNRDDWRDIVAIQHLVNRQPQDIAIDRRDTAKFVILAVAPDAFVDFRKMHDHPFDKRLRVAKSLTLPDRKRLEVARALATGPQLLLLDEVMAGLRPTETDRIVAILRELNAQGLTILLIEHVMRAVMALASRVLVLHHGAQIALGAPAEVVREPAVIESYLGAEAV